MKFRIIEDRITDTRAWKYHIQRKVMLGWKYETFVAGRHHYLVTFYSLPDAEHYIANFKPIEQRVVKEIEI